MWYDRLPGVWRELIGIITLIVIPVALVHVIGVLLCRTWPWGLSFVLGYGGLLLFLVIDRKRSARAMRRGLSTPCPACGGSLFYPTMGHGRESEWQLVCTMCRREVWFTSSGSLSERQG